MTPTTPYTDLGLADTKEMFQMAKGAGADIPNALHVDHEDSFELAKSCIDSSFSSVYFRKPIVVNAYSIYTKDIKPKGFSVIEIDGFVTARAVEKTKQILDDPDLCQAMVDHNYELGKKFFSYAVLHQGLRNFMRECGWLPGEFE
jgi:hypothetical protein